VEGGEHQARPTAPAGRAAVLTVPKSPEI
jgi:hypothetical protein